MNIIDVLCVTYNHFEKPSTYQINITNAEDVNNYLMTKLTTHSHTHDSGGDYIWITPDDFDTIRWEVEELFECALIVTSIRIGDFWKNVFERI